MTPSKRVARMSATDSPDPMWPTLARFDWSRISRLISRPDSAGALVRTLSEMAATFRRYRAMPSFPLSAARRIDIGPP